MQKILKKQVTLYIILTSMALLSTSNVLTMVFTMDTINDPNCTSVKWYLDNKIYTVKKTDIDEIKNKQASIKKSNFLPHCALFLLIPSWGAVIGHLIGGILGKDQTNAGCAGAILGCAIDGYLDTYILPEHDNKPLHDLLKQKQAEYKNS